MATVAGNISAPPAPCATRAANRIANDGANPPTADAPAKIAAPVMNTRRRPSRSPSRPPKISNPANGSKLAVNTHWTRFELTWRSWAMSGRVSGTAV